ncbi:helix-turn-helix domain-containing protein [Mesorhizobium sp. A556]
MFTQNENNDVASDDTIGGRISLARSASHLTMAQAARRLGVQTSTWHAWECDRSSPRSNRLAMMAGVLGVSPSWLLTGLGSGPVDRNVKDDSESLLQKLRSASANAVISQQRVEGLLLQLEESRDQDKGHAAA